MDTKSLMTLTLFSLFLLLVSCEENCPIENAPLDDSTIFISYDEIFGDSPQEGPDRVQDFDLNSSTLFVHPTGAFGLYQYNLDSKELKELHQYSSGNYIAHDSIYVFFETTGNSIFRYNLVEDSTDLKFDLSGIGSDDIHINGMDVYQHVLYVTMGLFLVKLTLDGSFIESIPYSKQTVHMAIDNEIVYGIYLPDDETIRLSRFSLATKSFLDDKPFPTKYWDGIRAVDNKLYFCDYQKRLIRFVEIAAIQ